jgi:hypothetical protein
MMATGLKVEAPFHDEQILYNNFLNLAVCVI